MRAPRLTVGAFIDETDDTKFAESLHGVGHDVTSLNDPEEAADYELIVLSVRETDLPDLVRQLAPQARRGQIYLHTCLGYGVQVLDDVETHGAVVAAAHPLTPEFWVTAATDELGETIVELLVGELGGDARAVPDTQRARLAAARTHLSFVETVRRDATTMLAEALGNIEVARDVVDAGERRHGLLADVDGPGGVDAQHAGIEDPGLARVFRELVRRTAQHKSAHDAELWAIQKET